MPGLWNVDWLSANSQRSYPLSETASAKDTTGAFQLPQDFLVDLVLTVPAAVDTDPALYHLKSLAMFSGGVVLTFGYNGEDLALTSIARADHTLNKSYRLLGQGNFYDAQGCVTIGSLDSLFNLTPGVYTFDVTGGRLEPTVIRPDLRGVTSLVIQSGDELSDPLVGDILVQAGSNLRFTVDPVTNTVRLDCLLTGSDLEDTCGCSDPTQLLGPIKTINQVGANSAGNIEIQGDQCIRLDPIDYGFKMSDTCSAPCCGCAELTIIKQDQQFVMAQQSDVSAIYSRLDAIITQALNALIASKIGTSGGG